MLPSPPQGSSCRSRFPEAGHYIVTNDAWPRFLDTINEPSTLGSCLRFFDLLIILVVFVTRLMLIGLFLPFSALDKILNFQSAVDQAKGAVRSETLSRLLIFAGLGIEIFMSAAVLIGEWDRMAALILAGYCAITAIMWKQFWKAPDFRLEGESRGREIFWDFLKNFALAGGFLTLAFGTNAVGVQQFLAHPLGSSHPYTIGER